MADIRRVVAEDFGLKTLKHDRRQHPKYARPRQIAMYLCRNILRCSFGQIGQAFDRHHTTVMNACDVVVVLMVRRSEFRERVRELEDKVKREIWV